MEATTEKPVLKWELKLFSGSMELWEAGQYRVTDSEREGVRAMIAGEMGVLRYRNVPEARAACERHHQTGNWN
jgi:hypothetical protein